MTPDQLDDEAARPHLPEDPLLTPAQRAHGQRLARIHDMYRDELAAVAALLAEMRQASDGAVQDGARLAETVRRLEMTRNLALFGTVCGRECALLHHHHDIEERWMFPALAARADDPLQAVLDRLIAEHGIIKAMIDDLKAAADALAASANQADFDRCARAFAVLDRGVRSHFGYEESQLEAPLGRHAIPI